MRVVGGGQIFTVTVTQCASSGCGGEAPPSGGTDPGGEISYFHTDALGSVRLITAANGATVSRFDYQAFGKDQPGSPSPASTNAVRFTGKERDAETASDTVSGWSALDYFGARYYQSQTGRFTSVDPVFTWEENLVDPQRPLRYVDPDGRSIKLFTLALKVGQAVYKGHDIYTTVEGVVESADTLISKDSTASERAWAGVNLIGELSGISDVVKGGKAAVLGVRESAEAIKSSRAAMREAMREEGMPTSRPFVSQSGKEGRRQGVAEASDGTSRVVTQHPADKKHPQPHWHAAPPQLDSKGKPVKNRYGQIKYESGGSVVVYGKKPDDAD